MHGLYSFLIVNRLNKIWSVEGGDAKNGLIIQELRDELRQVVAYGAIQNVSLELLWQAARHTADLNDEIVILKQGNGAQVEVLLVAEWKMPAASPSLCY